MSLKWKQLLPAFSIILLTACLNGQETAYMDQSSSDSHDKVMKVNQNIEEHPAWNESPAEPEIGESAVEVPWASNQEGSKK